MATICNLPPSERNRVPLFLGSVPGPNKPSSLRPFLDPIINELGKLATQGIYARVLPFYRL